MQVVLSVDPSDPRTLQRQLFDQIRDMILDNRLRSGDHVPASRALSEQLGVSRNTVVLAYEQLLSEGYIESRPNVGTFVSSNLPERVMVAGGHACQIEEQQANDNHGEAFAFAPGVRAQTVISPATIPAPVAPSGATSIESRCAISPTCAKSPMEEPSARVRKRRSRHTPRNGSGAAGLPATKAETARGSSPSGHCPSASGPCSR